MAASQVNISQAKLKAAPIPVPPLSEQHRIVAKVDELMALCDRLEARQQDAEAAHARLVQALLDSLTEVRGAEEFQTCWQRVVAQFELMFRNDASVDALKLAICQMGVSGRLVQPTDIAAAIPELVDGLTDYWRKRSPRRVALAIVAEADRRYPLPCTWDWLHFGFVAETRLGKMLDAAKNKGGLKPYLRNANVQWDRFELDDLKELRLEASELDEYSVKVGDLLICEGGEPGRCAVWRDDAREIYFQKALHRARPLGDISADYLKICLQVDAATGVLSRLFTGATIKHLTGEKLERYAVPLPPPEEQRRIVAKVTELLALCDQLKARIAAARAKHVQLAGALVADAIA
jgi:type I restriction enzyme S subunit